PMNCRFDERHSIRTLSVTYSRPTLDDDLPTTRRPYDLVAPAATVTLPESRYTMSGSSQRRAPLSVPASSARPLTPLLLRLTPRIVGSEARSILTAAPKLSLKVLPVSVGVLVWMRMQSGLQLLMVLLVGVSAA